MEAVKEKPQLQKYPAYKDSGVEWLGEIPQHWEVKKLKFLLQEINNRSSTGDEELLSLSKTLGIIAKSSLEERSGGAASLVGYKKVSKNDVVINKMQAVNGLIAVSQLNGITSPDYSVYRSKNKNRLSIAYLGYLLPLEVFLAEFQRRVTGVMEGFIRLYTDDLYDVKIYLPPIEEQTAISNFLDEKCGKIDTAIAQKQQLIDLLKERKQIIIQEVVTGKKVWNAAKNAWTEPVEVKDSGVEWIGKIPEHWEVKRLKHIGDSIIGLTYSPNDLCDEEEGTLVLRSSNLFEGKLKYGEKENVYVNAKISDKLTVKENDILICSRNGSRDLIGKCALISKQDEGHSFGAFTTVFRSKINPYIFCILNSPIFKNLSGMFLTSTINQLTIGNLNSIEVPIPPESERLKIKNYLNKNSVAIDDSIALQQQQIEKLKEYKSSLIDAAVTGKVKVSNYDLK